MSLFDVIVVQVHYTDFNFASVTKIVDEFCQNSKLQLRCFNVTVSEEDINDSEAV